MAQDSRNMTNRSHGKGPRILFFSGGTALKDTSRELLKYTHNSIHLVTPFDSGGSSATLRRAFAMPAVGDLRSRLMALAEEGRTGNPEIYTLFAYRLSATDPLNALRRELASLARGSHPLIRQIPLPMRSIIRDHLAWFFKHGPKEFPLQGASVGNLLLASGYLQSRRRLGPVLTLYSRMVSARGLVRPIVDKSAHLAVQLASGEIIVGQHHFTGKNRNGETASITSPIQRIWLTRNENSSQSFTLRISRHTFRLINGADALCFPIGSFYSSVVANLLPKGVGRAVAENNGPKIFIPNLGSDPELFGHSVKMQVEKLLETLQNDAPEMKPNQFLTTVLCDPEKGQYPGGIPFDWLARQGIDITAAPLITGGSTPLAHPRQLAAALASLF